MSISWGVFYYFKGFMSLSMSTCGYGIGSDGVKAFSMVL